MRLPNQKLRHFQRVLLSGFLVCPLSELAIKPIFGLRKAKNYVNHVVLLIRTTNLASGAFASLKAKCQLKAAEYGTIQSFH